MLARYRRIGTLFCATKVFVPQVRPGADLDDMRVTAWRGIRDAYTKAVSAKLAWLHRSHWLLIASFVAVLVLLVWLAFLPSAPAPPTQVIILTPTPAP